MLEKNIIKNKNEVKLTEDFEKNMIKLFNLDFDLFINCGKQCQHLISLWKLSTSDNIINLLKELNLKQPIIATRPTILSSNKNIAKEEHKHTLPPHQDYGNMQGSINGVVVWIPLININIAIGPISLIQGSHLNGLVVKDKSIGFGVVDSNIYNNFKSFEYEIGDLLIFSAFLIHKSGDNLTNNIRWSCQFRYNDLEDKSFIERGYPHAFIYKPFDFLIDDFGNKEHVSYYFLNN